MATCSAITSAGLSEAKPFGLAPGRVMLVGDSLALPRPAGALDGAVYYDETYPRLLARLLERHVLPDSECVSLLVHCTRARTLTDVVSFLPEVRVYRPSQLIVHTGIVDCAPRVFSRLQQKVVDHLRPNSLKLALLRFVHAHRRRIILTLPMKTYTALPAFRARASEIAARCAEWGMRCAFISIAPPTKHLADRSPGIEKNIGLYNSALQEICAGSGANYIDVYRALSIPNPEANLLSDGHHLSPAGHRVVAEILIDSIMNLME